MKTKSLGVWGAALLVVAIARAMPTNAELPKPLSFARYAQMFNESPFAVATAPPVPTLLTDLYVASVAIVGNELVFTLASTTDKSFTLLLSQKR